MNASTDALPSRVGFPRSFRIAGHHVNSYKVFLCLGLYFGILVSAATAQSAGVSPLRVGAGSLLCALAGIVGARVYHLFVHLRDYRRAGLRVTAWNATDGGMGVLGALVIVPLTLTLPSMFGVPIAEFWDYLAAGIAFGGAWIRFGCVCNGCCVGRESRAWYARSQHDVRGVVKRRIPVAWIEIAWWILADVGLLWLWSRHFASGSYALGVLGWYGLGRVWLEPLREAQSFVGGRVRVNQLLAAALVIGSGGILLLKGL